MGVLDGYSVIELAGIGPAPMAGMMLADMGAKVIRIERPDAADPALGSDVSFRGKQSLTLDLKHSQAIAALLRLVTRADVLIDPYRPAVCERLGIGPDRCFAVNPRLVYARMTGWGQHGPLSQAAGHDINYIALTGALHAIGPDDRPVAPLNLVGDMGGGGMLLAMGVLGALLETQRSGKGQVVDAAMLDGAAQLMWMFHGMQAEGRWDETRRESNWLDGGAYYYGAYQCADGKHVAIGSLEPKFYALLLEKLGLDPEEFADQADRSLWPSRRAALARVFLTRTQQQWCERLEGTDVCFAPVLTLSEAPDHPANRARGTYVSIDGVRQPAPAPRFDRTPSQIRHGARALGADTETVLRWAGYSDTDIQQLLDSGATGARA